LNQSTPPNKYKTHKKTKIFQPSIQFFSQVSHMKKLKHIEKFFVLFLGFVCFY